MSDDLAADIKLLREATAGCVGVRVGAILRTCLAIEEASARISELEARLAEATEIIRDVERAAGSECLYCDRDYGEGFDEHSTTCRIGKFLAAKGGKG